MSANKNLEMYIRDNKIDLSELSEKSGVAYDTLRTIDTKELRADDLMKICSVLNVNPMDFADKLNTMCRDCSHLGKCCGGSHEELYSGCVLKNVSEEEAADYIATMDSYFRKEADHENTSV